MDVAQLVRLFNKTKRSWVQTPTFHVASGPQVSLLMMFTLERLSTILIVTSCPLMMTLMLELWSSITVSPVVEFVKLIATSSVLYLAMIRPTLSVKWGTNFYNADNDSEMNELAKIHHPRHLCWWMCRLVGCRM